MIRSAVILVLLAAGACRPPTLSETLQAQQVALRAEVLAAEQYAAQWGAKVDARIAWCREQGLPDTPQARASCLGKYGRGEEIEADVDTLRAGFDVMAAQLPSMIEAARRIETFIGDEQ